MADLETDAALRAILEGTATETGHRFFAALVQNLAKALCTHGAWVTEYFPATRRLRALAFWMDGQWVKDYEVDITGSPCEKVIDTRQLVHFPDRLLDLYPNGTDVTAIGAVSYMGVPLFSEEGSILGHVAVIDRRPIPEDPRVHAIFKIFAARAAAELRRLRAEEEVRAREEKVGRLLGSAMDAIIELDDSMRVTSANPASEKIFLCTADKMIGQDFRQFLTEHDARRLASLIADLDERPEGRRSCWVSGGLTARCRGGGSFPAEATLARYEAHHQRFTTMILRNVRDRIEAEQQIQSLREEREILREELEALHKDSALIGDSLALTHVLRDINQVATTDATVLIIGETGTGKELVARAIHAASRRSHRPLITVNCAAIPATLIESEFFGHEPGAFTGATKKREGRFALADKGTIFLDEIGELPLDLQPKLLRVLQEGEYDSVGGSTTRKADVRVLAATNRDLAKAVKEGRFRQDLFYRLNVFPIHVPPLRERGDDVITLAAAFAERYAAKLGRTVPALSGDAVRRLKSYHWPGNVRELQNVIERAVITATEDTLNLARALPEAEAAMIVAEHPAASMSGPIRTARELEEFERANILRALQSANWKVSGDQGAARLLGMNPSTLASRMKALRITKPQ
ncbi:MAG TPA: sigma 54-interacting transcriptional regulator [Nitrospira sp.]|nr:sigma 54-interacting transcriptional regulator [Nitrospira sp.]